MAGRRSDSSAAPEGYVRGDLISLADWHAWRVALSQSGRAVCYLGYCPPEGGPGGSPYYGVPVAARRSDGRESRRFVSLFGGALWFDTFFDANLHYRICEERVVLLPTGTNKYFGVVDRATRREDCEFTRQLFGATFEEVEVTAKAFARLCGRFHPRVTFSRSRSNWCDITDRLIPKEFPYLAFEESQYAWSHVSLFGFYRLLGLLCGDPEESRFRLALVAAGAQEDVVSRLIECGQEFGVPFRLSD